MFVVDTQFTISMIIEKKMCKRRKYNVDTKYNGKRGEVEELLGFRPRWTLPLVSIQETYREKKSTIAEKGKKKIHQKHILVSFYVV